jgi:ArsR family transcriptional regulator, arsenate/arsenite/antimonite-responsive transcriptional repressor
LLPRADGRKLNMSKITEKTAVKALAALAQDTRLAIYRLLVQQGPAGLSVGDIAGRLELANATLSFHLKELANADLITARQDGRFIYYSANYPAMNGLVDYLTENCCKGNVCDVACAPLVKRKRRAS